MKPTREECQEFDRLFELIIGVPLPTPQRVHGSTVPLETLERKLWVHVVQGAAATAFNAILTEFHNTPKHLRK